jgi:hypothetical protein
LKLHAHAAGSLADVVQRGFGIPLIVGVDQEGDASGMRRELTQQLEALRFQLVGKQVDSREIAGWPGGLLTSPSRVGSSPTMNTMGIVLVAAFAAAEGNGPEPTMTDTRR